MKKSGRLLLILFIGLMLSAAIQAEEKLQIDIHGYLSQGFMYSNHNNYLADTKNGTFQFNELGINFSTQVTEKLRVGMQFAALDLGDLRNDKIFLDWAYADYRWSDWFGIRVGKIKLPLGFYNKTRDIDMLRTFILLPQSIYSETYRDTLVAMKGIGAYGQISLRSFGDISYEFLAGTMNIDKDGSTTKGIEQQPVFKVEKYNIKKAFCGQIAWETPLKGLRLGLSRINIDLKLYGVIAKDFDNPPLRQGDPMYCESPVLGNYIYSLEYTWRDLVLAMEYSRQDQTNLIYIHGLEPIKNMDKFRRFYASATYRFSDLFEAGVYYSEFCQNSYDKDGTKTPYNPPFYAYQKDACLSFRFDPNDHWTFKLEGHMIDGVSLCFRQDNPDVNGDGIPDFTRKWHLLAAKMTFSF